ICRILRRLPDTTEFSWRDGVGSVKTTLVPYKSVCVRLCPFVSASQNSSQGHWRDEHTPDAYPLVVPSEVEGPALPLWNGLGQAPTFWDADTNAHRRTKAETELFSLDRSI